MRRSGLCSPQPWTSIPLCRVNMPWHTHASASTKVVYVFCLSHTLRHLARFLAPSRCYPSQTDSAVRPCNRSLLERSIRMPGTRFDGRFFLLPRSDRCPRPRDSVACHFLVYTRVCTRACVRACVCVRLVRAVQVTCFLAGLFSTSQASCALVVCPKSVIRGWETELRRWLVETTCRKAQVGKRLRVQRDAEISRARFGFD